MRLHCRRKLQFTIFGKTHTLTKLAMTGRSDTLQIGGLAPELSLGAANRPGTFSLAEAPRRGPVIVDCLRGTWGPNCGKRIGRLEPLQPEIERRGPPLLL